MYHKGRMGGGDANLLILELSHFTSCVLFRAWVAEGQGAVKRPLESVTTINASLQEHLEHTKIRILQRQSITTFASCVQSKSDRCI